MPKILIAVGEDDGALYRLARRVAERGPAAPRERVQFREIVLELCRQEAGAVEVNVAQMTETLARLRTIFAGLLEKNPLGLLAFLEEVED